jgi:hypothetical protein
MLQQAIKCSSKFLVIFQFSFQQAYNFILLNIGTCMAGSISLRGKNWADKTNLTLPLFIEVPVPSQESKQFNPSTFY